MPRSLALVYFVRRTLLTILGSLLAANAAWAQQTASPPPSPWYKALKVNWFLSASANHNLNEPPSGTNQFHVFDFDTHKVKLDVAEVVIQKPAVDPGQGGFRFDGTVGSSVPRIEASYGLFRDASGDAHDYDIQQAYASYIFRVGRGLRLDGGKFVTHMGYELIEGYDGYNDNVSRSFLFGYAIPFTHTGARVSYGFSDKVSALFIMTTGWDAVKDNNGAVSLGGQVAVVPAPNLSLYFNYIGGAEQLSNNTDVRRVFDVVAIWKVAEKVTLGFNTDYGTQKAEADETGVGDATWSGFAVYQRVAVSSSAAVSLRLERFDDPDGARTGIAQTLTGFTVTPELRPAQHVVVRGDLRFDHSDVPVFEHPSSPSQRQVTASLNFIYVF